MKKIGFKDFKRETKMLGMMTADLKSSLEAANRWIATENIDVINVETHTIHQTNGKVIEDGIRVWYVAGR